MNPKYLWAGALAGGFLGAVYGINEVAQINNYHFFEAVSNCLESLPKIVNRENMVLAKDISIGAFAGVGLGVLVDSINSRPS